MQATEEDRAAHASGSAAKFAEEPPPPSAPRRPEDEAPPASPPVVPPEREVPSPLQGPPGPAAAIPPATGLQKLVADYRSSPVEGAGAVAQRRAELTSEVLAVAKGVLGAEIGPDEPLMDAGLDSIAAVELGELISATFRRVD